ncbi:MAG: outer membrane beta-barrel protein [Myxococcales bacterium]
MRRLLWVLFFSAPAALAAPSSKTLAVLEFDSKLPRGTVDSGYLADVVRTAAKDAAPSLRIMTRESMLVLLEASGKKLEDCQGECEVDTGRRLGADLVISGQVLKFGTQFKVNMKMHDTRSGELLQGAQASGATLDELDHNLTAAVKKLLGPLETANAAPEQATPPPPQERTTVTAPAPQPAAGEPSHFGASLAVAIGYYDWSIDVAGASSSSGITYGLSGDVFYKVNRVGIGVMLGYDRLQYTDSTSGNKNTSNALSLGAVGRLQLPGNWWLFAGAGYLSLSENQGSGFLVLGGLDIPIAGPFNLRAFAEYRHASTSVTLSTGTPLDITSSIISAAAAAALVF